MLHISYGPLKLSPENQPESSGVPVSMAAAKNSPRQCSFLAFHFSIFLRNERHHSIICYYMCRLTAITQLAHHGMIFVPVGYTFGSGMFEMNEVRGGSSYGAGTYAADGSRQPTELELQQAFHQGKYIAEITKKLKIKT